jgi:hypothetical protein
VTRSTPEPNDRVNESNRIEKAAKPTNTSAISVLGDLTIVCSPTKMSDETLKVEAAATTKSLST